MTYEEGGEREKGWYALLTSDTQSQKSTVISTLETDEAFYEDIVDYFSLLTDKKIKNRSLALDRIQQCLLRNVQQDVFLKHADSLCTDLLSYIRKEKPVEVAISSCRILALLQISLALDTSVTYDIAYPVLLQRLRSSKSVPLLIECFRTASIILFVCDARDEDVLDLLSLLSDRISSSSTDPALAATAIDMWMFLSSTRSRHEVLAALPSMVTWVSAKLSQQSVAIRIAASKCLAFLRELHLSVARTAGMACRRGRRRCRRRGRSKNAWKPR
ncbi:uncharacterized protein [Blastocystis hominis]|uniref:Interferon-related developmental regulator N-terminal domain-containing protein n=1 Tax=Blastocystis hominis TaxID=12968 RepID=D8MAA0_BLAHO|nr:uncharacterized protein [Blastocystis hominis]CBK24989.2 unnamed protein product [Blastocystis hominis]|eukprot:XP_012899037.1 uncharacterized protein [Blastocystis hominis]